MFPNPSVHITYEENLKRLVRRYDLKSPTEIPVELMLHGGTLGGILGPLFFAAPLALVALRWPEGRELLLAASVLLLPYFSNIGTRFVLPALPFISLALALALTWIGTAAPALLLAIALLNAAATVRNLAHTGVAISACAAAGAGGCLAVARVSSLLGRSYDRPVCAGRSEGVRVLHTWPGLCASRGHGEL